MAKTSSALKKLSSGTIYVQLVNGEPVVNVIVDGTASNLDIAAGSTVHIKFQRERNRRHRLALAGTNLGIILTVFGNGNR